MKKLIILFLIFVTTGCSVTYNVNLDSYFEKTDYSFNNSNYDSAISNLPVYTDETEEDSDGSYIYASRFYTFSKNNGISSISNGYSNLKNYKRSTMLNSCYKLDIYEGKSYVSIKTNNHNYCFESYPELEKLTINLSTIQNVFTHNADNVEGNTYTWVIDKTNYRSKSIIIKYGVEPKKSSNKKGKKVNKKEKKSSNNFTIYLLCGLFFIALFGIIIFSNKINKK